MLAQMAQLSTVSGIQDMQTSLKQLVNTMMASQTTQAAALVGHQVVAPGSTATLTSNGLSGAVDLTQDTNQLAVGIYDSAGQLVKQMDLGAQSKGTVPFSWDGIMDNGTAAPNGLYQIKAMANANGSAEAMGTYVASKVDSVTVDSASQNITLNTSGGDAIKISDIKQLM
jgi:flagellar basal-body rod modification protein FlgD